MKQVMISALLALGALSAGAAAPSFDDYVQNEIKDFQLSAKATKANQAELVKISTDFATAYRGLSSTATVRYKEPAKIRIDGKVERTDILYIVNGDRKVYSIPKLHLRQVEDIKTAPGKRQTSLDFGFITPGLLKFASPHFVREDHNGELVFDITWKGGEDSSRHRVWINPNTKIVVKREWYNQQGRLMATFYYKGQAKVSNGIYMPTSVQVYNIENKFAGETTQSDFKVNIDIPDSLFEIK